MVEIGSGAKREVTVYLVNEDDSYTVVAQLSPEFTAIIVKEWRKLRGENADLKAQLAEQGRKIDMLCEAIMRPLITVNQPNVPAQPKKRNAPRFTRKHVYNYNVIEVKALHSRGTDIPEIAATTGYSPLTVQRITRGERDHLLKA